MIKSIQIINGPNLNLLGNREREVYGSKPFDGFLRNLQKRYPDIKIYYFQSNVEGEIINCLQKVDKKTNGVILNAGGYTHTSVAIRDAVLAMDTDVIEVHISNIASREGFRHNSLMTGACKGCIMGFGFNVYILALEEYLLSL
jgi:3-dehydroquinate dehydratase-2